jgi:hypothetical protein
MSILGRIVAIAAIAFALPVHAQDRSPQGGGTSPPATVGGPLALTYVVPGVTDSGGADNTGVATTFHCTNTSTVSEQVQIVVRNFDGSIVGNDLSTVGSARTLTKSTHGTALTEDLPFLTPGTAINQGQAFIFATSQFVFCSAMVLDASIAGSQGVSLHMVRFSPLSGTQE